VSADTPTYAEPNRKRTAENVSGYLATIAAFASLIGIAWHPLRLILPSLLVALVAAGMAGTGKRLQLVCTMICAASLFLGLTVAVITSHPLW
jgi:biotin synthase-like enzyme